jgi:hypothetical protein
LQIDGRGNVAWAQSFAGADFKHVRTTTDGGSILAGRIDGESSDFYAVKLDDEGQVSWQRALDNSYDSREGVEDAMPNILSSLDDAYDVAERPDGSFVLVGESYGSFPIPQAGAAGYYVNAVLELSAAGELVDSRVSRAPDDALYGAAYGVAVRPNGSMLVVARGASQASDLLASEDVLLIQDGAFSVFDAGGNDYVYSGTLAGSGRGMPLQVTGDGGAILAVTSDSFAGYEEVWLLKLTRTGSIASEFRYDGSGSDYSNEHATSRELSAPVSEVAIDVITFTGDVLSEVTEMVTAQQTP